MAAIRQALEKVFGADSRIRVLHVQEFQAGQHLVPTSETATEASRKISHGVTLVKLFLRTTGPAPESPSPDAGTDVGMEIWLPEASTWNDRVRCQIQGAFMGDFRVTSPEHFSLPVCTDLLSGEIASELGYVVATTDGGHSNPDMEDFAYLMNANGSINTEGWKNIAYQSTHLLGQKTKELAEVYYGKLPKYTYLYGCSSGGRAAYHSAQKYPDDFDGLLIGAPSLTQSLMFPSLLHALVVIHNDLGGNAFQDGQIEMVSQRAISAGDQKVNGQHDLYITDWESNVYDPTKDTSVLAVSDGGSCTEPWALSLAQAKAINKIWYGPTTDGSIPDPSIDNGTLCPLRPHQLFWGKIRGTQLQHLLVPRAAAAGLLALATGDVSVASPNWDHGSGKGQDSWRTWTYKEYADALRRCHYMNESFASMDADDPSQMTSIQQHGAKILTYHGLADQVTNPQNSINYYCSSSEHTGGIEKTQEFHRLFLIPGMGHCFRAPGCVGSGNPPIPTLEELFSALVSWTEDSVVPEALVARSIDGKVSRPIVAYQGKPVWPAYKEGDIDSASSYQV